MTTGFTCADLTGPGVVTCADSNGSASPGTLDTKVPGSFRYTVTALSADGRRGTATIRYHVVPRPVIHTQSPAVAYGYWLWRPTAASFLR